MSDKQGQQLLKGFLSPFSIQENSWIIFLLIMAAIFWVYRLVKVFCNVLSYWEIRQFYIKALKIRMVSAAPGDQTVIYPHYYPHQSCKIRKRLHEYNHT